MKPRSLLSSIFWMYALSYVAIPLGYGLRIFYSGNLSIEDYGLFYAVLGFFTLLSMVNDLGFTDTLHYYGVRFFEKKQYAKLKNTLYYVFAMQIASSLIIALVIYLARNVLAIHFFGTPKAAAVLCLFIPYFLFFNISRTLATSFIMQQNFFYFSAMDPLRLLVILILSVPFFMFFSLSLEIIVAIWSIAYIILGIAYFLIAMRKFKMLKRYHVRFEKKLYSTLFSYAWQMATSTAVLIIATRIDVQVITYFRDLVEVAMYTNAAAIANILYAIVAPIGMLFLPLTSKLILQKKTAELSHIVSLLYRYSLLLVLPLVLLFTLYPKEILVFFFGETYVPAATALAILSWGMAFFSFGLFNSSFLAGMGMIKQRNYVFYGIAVLNLIASIIFAPHGYIAIAIVTSVSMLLMFLLTLALVVRKVAIRMQVNEALKILILNAVFVITVTLLKRYLVAQYIIEGIIVATLSIGLYTLLVLLWRIVNIKEVVHLAKRIIKPGAAVMSNQTSEDR